MLKPPTLDQLHTLGLHGMAKAFADLADAGQAKDIAHADWLAMLLDRGGVMAEGQAADGAAARGKTPPAGERRRRRLSRRPRSRSRPVPKALRGRLDRRPRQSGPGRLIRRRQKLAGLPHRSKSLPRRSLCPLSSLAKAVRGLDARSGAMGDIRALSNLSAAPTFSFSTTLASSPSTPAPVTICSKSSKSDMDADRRSSPHSSRCPPGTRSSATPPMPTPFWTASCTMRIASNSPARACAAPEANNPKRLDLRPRKGKKLSRPTSAAPRAGSSRYRGAASSRNPWAQSSRYRRAASPESAYVPCCFNASLLGSQPIHDRELCRRAGVSLERWGEVGIAGL